MTETTNKLRAVFLTALMIGSVFAAGIAFTGGAAAASTNGGSISPATVDEGTTNTHTVTLEATGVNTSGDSNQVFSVNLPNTLDISSTQVTNSVVNEGNVTVGSTDFDQANSTINVTLQDDGGVNSETVNVTFDITNVAAPSGISTNQTAQAQFGVDANADDDLADTDDSAYTDFQQLTIVDTGAPSSDRTFDDKGQLSNSLVYSGQTVTVDVSGESLSAGDDVVLRRSTGSSSSTPAQTLTVDGGLYVTFDTSSLETSDYFLAGGDLNRSNSEFEIVEQSISAEFGASSVVNDGTAVDFSVASDLRNTYDATVTVPGFAKADFVEVFGVTEGQVSQNDDGEYYVTVSDIEADSPHSLTFDGVDAGNYSFEVAVTDSTATDTVNINVTQAQSAEASFVTGTVEEQRGDIATFNVSLTSTDEAAITIGSDNAGYLANLTVTDDNGDGYVEFKANTYTMGSDRGDMQGNDAYYVDDDSGDTVTVIDEDPLPAPITTGTYQTTVRAGADQTANAQDIGQLYLRQGSITSQNVWTAPGTVAQADVIADGPLTQDDTIASGDYAVHEFGASGIYGAISAYNGSTVEQKFINASQDGAVSLTIKQTAATVGQNREAKAINVGSALQQGNATVALDAQNDTFYVVSDVDTLPYEDSRSLETGDAYNATFTVTSATQLVSENQSVSPE